MSFYIADVASAPPVSLTTTIIITIKPDPKGNLSPNDKNADIVKEVATNQSMTQQYIRQDVKPSGEEIYAITEKL